MLLQQPSHQGQYAGSLMAGQPLEALNDYCKWPSTSASLQPVPTTVLVVCVAMLHEMCFQSSAAGRQAAIALSSSHLGWERNPKHWPSYTGMGLYDVQSS